MSTADKMGSTNSSQTLSRSPSSQSRNAGGVGSNNLPPILFHSVHGDNIRLSRDQAVARRVDSFCKAIAFTNRPIRVNEKVYLKFVEISTSWSGALRFGFTSNDPANFRSNLPKYACPDLTNKPGNWAKALTERFAQREVVLSYYVDETGHVHYGINGEERGIFFDGVNVSGPLWGLVDIYGNTIAMELIEPRQQLNNNNARIVEPPDVNILLQQVSALQLDQAELPLHTYQGTQFNSLPFHRTCGTNVALSNTRCVASRSDTHFCQAYVFTARPLRSLEKFVIQILQTEDSYGGALAFGLTSCDPSTVQDCDLPDDADNLIDRPEYWVVKKDVADSPQRGDELTFMIKPTGEVQYAKNDQPFSTIMHIDHTQTLWAFFDLYGRTLKVKSLGVCATDEVPNTALQARVHLFEASNSPFQIDSSGSFPIDRDIHECVICYEKPVDSVVYKCGHMCMCYADAMALLRSSHCTAVCPLCRKPMEDVIRIYRS